MKESLRVLIIDDEAADRLLAIRALQREFPALHAIEVATQEDFDREITNGDFDIVITDYQLGWNNGLDLLRTLNRRKPTHL